MFKKLHTKDAQDISPLNKLPHHFDGSWIAPEHLTVIARYDFPQVLNQDIAGFIEVPCRS